MLSCAWNEQTELTEALAKGRPQRTSSRHVAPFVWGSGIGIDETGKVFRAASQLIDPGDVGCATAGVTQLFHPVIRPCCLGIRRK